jgi:CubicO group peptidase (beta-lactamase class C family)
VKDDTLVLARGWGVRTLGRPEPVTDRTLFAIASCTKAFTAAALAILVDEGRLDWDDPVRRHLPQFELEDPVATREMTVRDLLTHRGGLPAFGGDLMGWFLGHGRDAIVQRLRHVPHAWSFRSRYAYQNNLYVVAGQLVPAVTGKSWDRFVQERIFTPLGMDSTGTEHADLARHQDVAAPHAKLDGRIRPVAWRNLDGLGPAASVHSSVRDMALWIRLQLAGGVLDGRRIYGAAAAREMHAPQMALQIQPPAALARDIHLGAYALGWVVLDYRGRKLLYHDGSADGMTARVFLMPEERLGGVILANLNLTDLVRVLMYRLLDRQMGGRVRDLAAESLRLTREAEQQDRAVWAALQSARRAGTQPSLPLESYAGTYRHPATGDLEVRHEGGRLQLQFAAGPHTAGRLEHWHHDTFLAAWADPMVPRVLATFTLDADGRPFQLKVAVPASPLSDPSVDFETYTLQRADASAERNQP